MDELERILAQDERLRPSSGLTDAVMHAVRNEAAIPAPLAFPWKRLAAGLIACLVLFVVGLALTWTSGDPPAEVSRWSALDWESLVAHPRSHGLGLAVAMLGLTWFSSRFALRLAGYER